MYKFKINRIVIAIVLSVFALTPYHAIFSMTVWKDVPFGGIVLVLSVTLWRILVIKKSSGKIPTYETVLFFIFGLLMCIFRSNGFYAYFLLLLVIPFIFWRKHKAFVLTAFIVFVCAVIIKIPVYNHFGIQPPDTIESLSIPAQHISRAICREVPLTEEEYNLLSQVVDVEAIPTTYEGYCSDAIKELVRRTDNQEFINEHKFEFFKLWLNLGLRSPLSYILAQVDGTIGYWYPDTYYWVYNTDIYPNEHLEIYNSPLVGEQFQKILNFAVTFHRHTPITGIMWSIGAHSWLCIFLCFMCIVKKAYHELLIYLPVIAVLLTLLIATPVFAEFRYAYSMFTCTPLLLTIPFTLKVKYN